MKLSRTGNIICAIIATFFPHVLTRNERECESYKQTQLATHFLTKLSYIYANVTVICQKSKAYRKTWLVF